MNDIKREYFKHYRLSTVFIWVWAAIMTAGLFLTARNNQNLMPFAIAISSAAVLYALVITVLTFTAPAAFKKNLKKLP